MIGEVTCRQARLWLQAPAELDALTARHLDRHLLECNACGDYRRSQLATDNVLQGALTAAASNISVREVVADRLRAQTAGSRSSGRWRRPKSLRVLVPSLGLAFAAGVAALGATFLPSIISPRSSVTPAVAAFHPRRPFIGYPLAIDPSNRNHLLVGAWGQVYESFTGGAPWHQLGPLPGKFIVRGLAIDSSDPHHYLVATLRSILVSNDSGSHWTTTARNMLGAENMFLFQDPTRRSTFYSGPSVVWKSGDRGQSWSIAGDVHVFAPNGIQSLTVAPDGRLYTGIWGGGVAFSNNDGKTWTRISRGLATHVMDVELGSGSKLWAATDRGPYISRNAGASWQRAFPPQHLFTTAVLPHPGYVLIGGDGAIYRSSDDGLHWNLSFEGLPLSPYVNSFVADPHDPDVVYVSLNGDGIYRSNDGGQTWTKQIAGLPINLQEGQQDLVLLRRHGQLWHTDSSGADPGNLTIDHDVTLSALSPDGQSVAYVSQTGSEWTVRVISSGGSAAKTLLSAANDPPRRLLWSPDSSQLAIIRTHEVVVPDVAAHLYARGYLPGWPVSRRQEIVAWTRDGENLLVWDRLSHLVVTRAVVNGISAPSMMKPGSYPTVPVVSPGGQRVAYVSGAQLFIGPWGKTRVTPLSSFRCVAKQWSTDGQNVLLTCPRELQIRDAQGGIVGHAKLPSSAMFAPTDNRTLLYFNDKALWRWTSGSSAREIVPNASA